MNGFVPARLTVELARFEPSGQDPYGNPIPQWAPPVTVLVYGWAPASADTEPFEAGRAEVDRHMDLLVPPGVACGPRDRWTVAGQVWEQVGHPEDFTNGPFGFAPGVRVDLRRVEG